MLVDLRPTVEIAGRTEEWVPRGAGATARSLNRKVAAAGEDAIRRSDTGEIDPEALLNALHQEFDAALDRLDRVEARVLALEKKAKVNRGKGKPRPKAKSKQTAKAAANGKGDRGTKGRGGSTSSTRKRPKKGKPALNDVSFEQLRALGLSITHSAKFVATRDARGGFDSLDDLNKLDGIPESLREKLRTELAT